MFSPEGYIGFDTLRAHLGEWANQIQYAYLMESEKADPSIAFSETFEAEDTVNFRIAQFSRDRPLAELPRESERWRELAAILATDEFHLAVIFHCMFAKCVMKLDTLLSSPNGTVMRPDEYLFIHMDRLDWVHPNWPINKTPELRGILDLYEENNFSDIQLSERYCFLDVSLGVVKLKNNSVSEFKTSSHFGTEDYADKYIETHVMPFLGWAPIWAEKNLPDDMAQFLEDIGAFETRWDVPSLFKEPQKKPTPKKKRGPKPGPAKELFYKRYPDGIPDELSAEFVAAQFAAEGVVISARQITNYDTQIRLRK